MAQHYTLSDFDYDLPERLIAQQPARPRDHARLLVYKRSDQSITDDHFYNLADYLPHDTTLVVNKSKVEKCRLLFEDGKIEIFILEALDPHRVRALVRPGKKFRKGDTLELAGKVRAEVLDIDDEGIRTLHLEPGPDDERLQEYRYTPFPPYIKQNESLSEEYQTVFADEMGSKAAPTAGLHFTDELIEKVSNIGISWEEVTLHVGLGTFAPVKEEDIENHTMHSEWYQMDAGTAERLNRAGHITAVGTTSVRVLESMMAHFGTFKAHAGETDIFIRPGYKFRAINSLITNFHLPKSTLLMLVAALTGYEEMQKIYQHAIAKEYSFYSFGDAMLIL